MNRLVVKAGGPAIGLALLLSGCGGTGGTGPSTSGPFGHPGDSHGVQCFPVTRHGSVGTFGGLSFHNPGNSAKIDNVTLINSHDMQIVAAWVVPITGTDLLGVWSGYPPDGDPGQLSGHGAPGVQWEHRQHAAGAVIPHTPGQDVENLVLMLKPSGAVGTAKDVTLDYQSGGTRYRYDFQVGVIVYNGNSNGCLSKSQPKL